MSVIFMGVNSKKIGEVVHMLLLAGNAVTVEREATPCAVPECRCTDVLVRIEYTKSVNEETRATKAAWKEKLRSTSEPIFS